MVLRMFRQQPEEALPGVAEYGDVVDLVRKLGPIAVDEFLTDIGPHLAAVQRREKHAAEALAVFLHDCAVSAVVVDQCGGFEQMERSLHASPSAPMSHVDAVEAVQKHLAS